MPEALKTLAELPADQLAAVSDALHNQWLTIHSSTSAIAELIGNYASHVSAAFDILQKHGFTNTQATLLFETINTAKKAEIKNHTRADLVISGPDVPGIPTAATEAVVQSLFQEAQTEIILAGYAFHNAKLILEPLSKRLQSKPALSIILHVDISRGFHDTSTNENIVARFANVFWKKHWPWTPRPVVFFDPRALMVDPKIRACLHAKVIIVDRLKLLITSANFTEAAQRRNIEAGIVLHAHSIAKQMADYLEGLRNNKELRQI
jgi:phosphatidylserine/phosphatidylglycerophosphate/cardiolipin synthase-like enzyme